MAASRFGRIALVASLLGGLTVSGSRADLIFLKDGYVLQGTVRRETTAELDPVSKEMTLIPKGFFMLDDGPRRIYFSPAQVRIVEKLAAPVEERVVQRKVSWILNPPIMPPIEEVLSVSEWNYKTWKREYHFRAPNRPDVGLYQGLATITPYFARVDAVNKFRWSAAHLTREWDPEVVYKLLINHPDFQDPPVPTLKDILEGEKLKKPKKVVKTGRVEKVALIEKPKPRENPRDRGKPKPEEKPLTPQEKLELAKKYRHGMIVARRMRLCDFFAQAGWFDVADRELDRLLKDMPDEKERVSHARNTVLKLRARDLWEQTKNWYQAGRYEAVRKRLGDFPVKNPPDRIKADIREMKARLAGGDALLGEAGKALEACSKAVGPGQGAQLASAVRVIQTELNRYTVGRLDAFLGQVRDANRQKARGRKPTQTPERLLALAVSGWVLGSPSAEAVPLAAVNLWKTRQMVLEYLREPDERQRKKILDDYLAKITPRVDLDEIAQLIDNLPPAQSAKAVPGVTEERKLGAGRNAVAYHLRLPPEYTPSRHYPVLIVLPNSGEKPKAMLEKWANAAAHHGYILAAPDWERGFGNGSYNYTDREHDTVTLTLRDLRRRFQVDSDRVFLFGLGEAGKMAFDVGLAHPHLFAGVLPMGAGPNKYPRRYWRNAQYLPFYVVNGTRAGDSNTLLREQFDHWVVRGYPTLWIEYKGRGVEWFSAEVPNMFDWMRNQRRAFPLRQLGTDGLGGVFGNEFCTMRPEDNRFYWLSTSGISGRHLVPPSRWSNLVQPASLTGRIDAQTNEITLKTQGLNQIGIWLGRNPKGQYMIDFDKPVTVRVGFKVMVIKRRVQPELKVLLEDLYERGDRKHLFVARIDLRLN
jgi:hypothetical protein